MKQQAAAVAAVLDQFAQQHWEDRFTPDRATIAIEGDHIHVTVGRETLTGYVGAPLLLASGAWALIFAQECDGRYGHRVDGRINRVWPSGVGRGIAEHAIDAEVAELARLWPGTLFSDALYDGVTHPGHPRRPESLEDAPSRTTLTGVLKRVAQGADAADPLERLKVVQFIEDAVRNEWTFTGEDKMMTAIGPALDRLAEDSVPAIREVALLALETCAEACWRARAYGLYEPICRRLIDAGLNAHLQYARLAESAYASGDLAQGDRLWALALTGQNPLRALQLSAAYDHIGDWSDLHTRILRQAGGAQFGYSNGTDPNPARAAKLEKQGNPVPDADSVRQHRTLAATLLARAAEGAEARLAIDLPAIRAGQQVPLGSGTIDPAERRLFLPEIFTLQAQLAAAEGDAHEHLRLMFRALDTGWQLARSVPDWRMGYEESVVPLAAARDDADLAALAMPAYLAPLVAEARQAQAMAGSEDGRTQLFWQGFLRTVREEFLERTDIDSNRLPGDELVPDFHVACTGGRMTITHPVLAQPVTGSLAAPVLTALQAWHAALIAAHGRSARLETLSYRSVTLDAEGVAQVAQLADAALAQGAEGAAIMLYRFAHGTDPLVHPWCYNDPVDPLPIDAVPEQLRDAVVRRSPLEAEGGHAKLKPRGRRVEALARDYDPDDALNARWIAHWLRDAAGSAGSSEIERVSRSAPSLLSALWEHPDPAVREMAILAIFPILYMFRLHAPGLSSEALHAVAAQSGVGRMPETDED